MVESSLGIFFGLCPPGKERFEKLIQGIFKIWELEGPSCFQLLFLPFETGVPGNGSEEAGKKDSIYLTKVFFESPPPRDRSLSRFSVRYERFPHNKAKSVH